MIGKQFLVSSLIWGIGGGLLALGVRWQLGFPGTEVPILHGLFGWEGEMPGEGYNLLVTMHASIMIFFVVIPLLVGAFGNFVVPIQIGANDMAFPFLNALSFWLMWPAFIFMGVSFFVEGHGAGSGWTGYPPLSHLIDGDGQTLWCIGVWFVGWSSICGAVNYITTIVKMRAPGMTFFRMPLTTWSIFITSILVLCGTPVLGSAVTMLAADRTLGSSFFLPTARMVSDTLMGQGQGQVILWQHLFWFYSHPAVYIMVLPAMGMVSDMLSNAARKPIFGYRPMVYSMGGIAFLGFIVWGHHMFQAGMNPGLGRSFMIATMVIALPSAVKTFNWLGTIYRSRMQFRPYTLAALAFIAMWIIGGLSGIFMAATPVDVQIHDTYAIVAHFHYVVFGATLFAVFGSIYYWFPKMYGRFMNAPAAHIHLVLTFIFFNLVFFPMHVLGSRGMLRRTADPYYYGNLHGMLPMNRFITICAIILGLVQVILAVNFVWSMWRGRKCEQRNPWKANTLMWATPTPPINHGNFDTLPTVHRGAYEYSVPGADDDYLPQFEAPPATEPTPVPEPETTEESPKAS
ncbi:MAG: cytochrome c oxidase subunit I [Phycisphaeraceae bacterium]|nr:cytochrome c oxidase subunit I [Phycisphaeraceae bacterium]